MPEKCKIENSCIKTRIADICLYDDRIVQLNFCEEYCVEIDDVIDIQNAIIQIQLTNVKNVGILVYAGRYGTISKEAREMDMFTFNEDKKIKYVAIITKELHQKLLGTIYFKLRPKLYVNKLFNSERKAIAWIKKKVN